MYGFMRTGWLGLVGELARLCNFFNRWPAWGLGDFCVFWSPGLCAQVWSGRVMV